MVEKNRQSLITLIPDISQNKTFFPFENKIVNVSNAWGETRMYLVQEKKTALV